MERLTEYGDISVRKAGHSGYGTRNQSLLLGAASASRRNDKLNGVSQATRRQTQCTVRAE
jgi:hypothetical protein